MHFYEHGEGPAVLLLHGSPTTTRCFGPLVEALRAHRRILIPDLPGYGVSLPLEGAYTMARVQALLEEELLARGVREAAVVGLSGGAYRAIALAFSRRVRVTSVVSLGGFAGVDDDVRTAWRDFARLALEGFDVTSMWLQRMSGPDFAQRFPGDVADILAWIDAAPRAVIAAELEALADAEDLRPRLGELGVPLVARVGELDATTPPSFSEDIVRNARRAELQVVAGCGHALLYEDKAATVAAVVRAVS